MFQEHTKNKGMNKGMNIMTENVRDEEDKFRISYIKII